MRLSAAASIAEGYHQQRQLEEQRKTGQVIEALQTAPQQKKRNKITKSVPPPVPIKNKRPAISKSSPKMAATNYSPMLPSITAFAEAHDTSKPKRPISAEAQSNSANDGVTQGSTKPSKPNKPKPSYRRIVSAV